jgi:hypothetical protein|tara:strand:+ start:2126 stop:2353 length:228 start_codon:yes stop_codon:yes gene_type:complete
MNLKKIIELVRSGILNEPQLKKKLLSSGDKLHRFSGLEAASRQTAPWLNTASSPIALIKVNSPKSFQRLDKKFFV